MELTAKPVPKRRQMTGIGIESKLDFVAVFLLVIGILASVALPIFGGWDGLGIACLSVITAVVNWLILRSIAEIVRLQKRIAGLEYDGRISGSYFDTVMVCGNCSTVLHSDVACGGCGARLQKPGADEKNTDG